MSVATDLLGTIPAILGGHGIIEGTDNSEAILGTDNADVIHALGGDDFVQALAGSDHVVAGDGNDTVLGGEGDDMITGGAGDDVLRGDAGADTFVFNPSGTEGADTIVDFTAADGDVVSLSAAGLAASGLTDFSAAALDASEDFNIVANDDGDVEIQDPGGTITLDGVPFTEDLTFTQLESAGKLEIAGLVQGTDEGEDLTGTDGGDVIDAKGGDDTITPLSGDDVISTGAGHDQVNIDPSNPNEGADTITDFSVPSALDPTAGDFIAFKLDDILAADPDLPAADGDAASLSLADLDASDNWTLGASDDGNLLFTHPGGSVEFANAEFTDQQFADLGSSILVDGQEFNEPIAVEPPADGEQVDNGGEGATGGETTNGEQTTNGEHTTTTTGGEQAGGGTQAAATAEQTPGGEQTNTGGQQTTGGEHGGNGEDVTNSENGTSGDQGADGDQQVVEHGQLEEGAIA
jgi:Ca2+-binding RTX toxin-like protein